jgi:transcriptional regulator with PAS, ATPase and Fis domain
MSAEWPGNVRELENEILRAVTMASDQSAVGPEDLSPRFIASSKNDAWTRSGLLKDRVQYFEESVIRRTVAECGNNSSKAARVLGISRATLYKKLEK